MEASAFARAGIQAVRQNPKLILLEIAWRWLFGLGALLMLGMGYRTVLTHLPVTPADAQALHSEGIREVVGALLHIFSRPEFWRLLLSVLAALLLPIFVLWTLSAGFGRQLTLSRAGLSQSSLRQSLACGALRFIAALAAFLAWFGWMVLSSALTLNAAGQGNWLAYILLVALLSPVIGIVWGAVNWILSIAPVPSGTALALMPRLRELVSATLRERKLFFGISGWFGLPRLCGSVLLAVVFLICAMVLPWQSGSIVFAVASLAYCAFADALYLARLMAYSFALSETKAAPGV